MCTSWGEAAPFEVIVLYKNSENSGHEGKFEWDFCRLSRHSDLWGSMKLLCCYCCCLFLGFVLFSKTWHWGEQCGLCLALGRGRQVGSGTQGHLWLHTQQVPLLPGLHETLYENNHKTKRSKTLWKEQALCHVLWFLLQVIFSGWFL